MARGVPAKKIIPLLEENGFEEKRVKGDHHQFKKAGHPSVVTLAYAKPKDEIPPGTLKSVLRQAGLEDRYQSLMGHDNGKKAGNIRTIGMVPS